MSLAAHNRFVFALTVWVVCILPFARPHPQDARDRRNGFFYEREIQSPVKRVIRADIKCTKLCNYRPISELSGSCFGSFEADCFVSQYFADGHVMETSTNINCIGEFTNTTGKGSDYQYINTRCKGQFEQVQVLNIFEPFVEEEGDVESLAAYKRTHAYFNSYTCRSLFISEKRLTLSSHVELAYLNGNGEMSCQGSQTVKIQKDYCRCTRDTCTSASNREGLFEVDPSVKQMVFKRSAKNDVAEKSPLKNSEKNSITSPVIDVSRNFKIVAEHDPDLARRVAEAVYHSVSSNGDEDLSTAGVAPVILEYYSSLNIYKPSLKEGPDLWSSNPTTSWLHVLCNGNSAALSTSCDGVMSANVRFNQAGEAFMMCKGGWRTYDYITYFCKGVFSDEDTDSNSFGTFFSKTSRCEGTVAITPLSTKTMDHSNYYGLMEVCNGKSMTQSSYSLEELDHRYMTNVVDPKDAQHIICLMSDRNCAHLHYLTQ